MPPKRGRKAPAVPVRGGWDVLPHNMGALPSSGASRADTLSSTAVTTESTPQSSVKDSNVNPLGTQLDDVIEAVLEELLDQLFVQPSSEASENVQTPNVVTAVESLDKLAAKRQLRPRKARVAPLESAEAASQAVVPQASAPSLIADSSLDQNPATEIIQPSDEQSTRRQLRSRPAKAQTEKTDNVAAEPCIPLETGEQVPKVGSKKRKRATKTCSSSTADDAFEPGRPQGAKPKKEKRKPKKTKDNPYGLTPGETPFPDRVGPNAEQCTEVYRLLAGMHDDVQPQAPEVIPAPSLDVTGCGEVPSVLDALIRTLLSGATTFANAAKMLKGLEEKFGVLEEGIGKGSIDWNKVRLSPLEDVIDAIRQGGLATIKAKSIKTILDMVHEENIERHKAYLAEKETGNEAQVLGAAEKTQGQKDLEILKTEKNILSLDHIRDFSATDAMKQFTKYPGIGVKTSACVILFCLQRPCFAVDTHVHKFSKWLGWVPEKANEDDTFSHLEVRCPDNLKYGLHQLFIRHGQTCGRCKRSTAEGTDDWKAIVCPLEHLLNRYDKRQAKAKPRSTKKRKVEEDTEANGEEEILAQLEGDDLAEGGEKMLHGEMEIGSVAAGAEAQVAGEMKVEEDDIAKADLESELSELDETAFEDADYEP